MSDFYHIENDFLQTVIHVIEENMSDENFGVSELAEAVSMSRSNLLRKVKSLTDFSVSVLIRQVRLRKASQLLQDKSYTVSEISYQVGFGSTSYFIKCFRERYGYPPGEQSKILDTGQMEAENIDDAEKQTFIKVILTGLLTVVLIGSTFWFINRPEDHSLPLEKSIAVLPFKNDSGDSSNVYIINGLMEAVLNDLQKIEDLRVISRTSTEKYRNQSKSIPEIANELSVSYFVEGSGQKIGDQVLLTIQLIEGNRDNHLWSKRYIRTTENIFDLQAEVAKDIAAEIEVIITPEEQQRIEKVLTNNPVAYDLYLKGLEWSNEETFEGLDSAVHYFKLAIAEDPSFAKAHAILAICYYYHDLFHRDKVYAEQINTHADKAILLDAELSTSQIAKGLYYMQDGQYELAVDLFEKALIYNPNSSQASNYLSDIYTSYIPDTKKYLTYALRGVKLDFAKDSVAMSYAYLHLSNALAQNGFMEEAEKYILQSLDYYKDNIFSNYLYAYILLAQDNDMERTKSMLIETLEMDTSRLDVIQEIAKTCYTLQQYDTSWYYYKKFLNIKNTLNLQLFDSENLKIGFVLEQIGRPGEAEVYFEKFKTFAEEDQSIYRNLNFAAYYAAHNQVDLGIEHLKLFSEEENYMYWFIYLEDDPIMNRLSGHPDFKPTLQKIIDKFWQEHEEIKKVLVDEGLM